MNSNDLFNYILEDEYWLHEAVEHFVLTAGKRLEYIKESYKENVKESERN